MPVINMDVDDLERLVGKGFSLERFTEEIPMIGATVEKMEDGQASVEFFPNRPDLFSVEGVARAYCRFSGLRDDDMLRRYRISKSSGMRLEVDPGLEEIRPVIGAAYIKGVKIDDEALISIMNLQEKIHITVGRKRRKVAIGIHDAGPLKPPFRYWAAEPHEVSFVPLQKDMEWDLERILKEHEKGTAYAWVLEGMKKYPIITDSRGQVLSFPPIINGELTRVSEETKDIFVDCTGWDKKAVMLAVNIVCSQLMDRGGKLESVEVVYPDRPYFSDMGLVTEDWPRYSWEERSIDLKWAGQWLGNNLDRDDIKASLKKMEYEDIRMEKDKVKCLVPPWRNDILHPADIAEDIAIGYGFQRFPGESSNSVTTGSERRLSTVSRYARNTFIGLGFLEVKTLALSNQEAQFELMGREEMAHIKLTNPITIEHTMARLSAIPTLMSLLRSNRHRDLPQRLFEVADVMVGNHNMNLLSGVSEDNKASFTEVKGYVQRLLQDLGIAFVLEPADLGHYINGRAAAVMLEAADDSLKDRRKPFPELEGGKMIPLGHFGEVHPRLIESNELTTPVSAFELDMDLMIELSGV